MKSLDRLARVLSKAPARTPIQPTPAMDAALATVQTVNNDGTIDVLLNGSVNTVNTLQGCAPNVGDAVWTIAYGTQIWAVDIYRPYTPEWTLVGSQNGVPFRNGWGNFSSGSNGFPRYQRVGTKVYLEGGLSAGTVGDAAFVLPAALSPKSQHNFFQRTSATDIGGTVQIGIDGSVTPVGTSDTFYVSLDGIVFDVT